MESPSGQSRSHIVLSGEGIGAGDRHLGSAGDEGGDEVCRLHGDMKAGHHTRTLERLFSLKLLFDLLQHRHMPSGPFYALLTHLGQGWILYHAIMQKYHLEFLRSI